MLVQFGVEEPSRVGFPDGKDAADGEVGVYNGGTIKGVKGDHVAIALCDLRVDGPFLTGEGFNEGVEAEVLLDNLVAVHVLV